MQENYDSGWRKVEGVIGHIRISCKLKGKVLSLCVTLAYTYSERQWHYNMDTTGEGAGWRKQLDKKNHGSEVSG